MSFKVLVVDDSKLARLSVRKLLASMRPGWDQFEAQDAVDALVVFRAERPQIVLMDCNMPGRDGLALAADIKAMAPSTEIAIISATIQTDRFERAANAGATFVSKPLAEDDLARFILAAEGRIASR